MIDYVKYFLTCTVLLWSNICYSEYSSIGNASFEGWLSNKKTKDVSAETANAVNNEPLRPPSTIGDMQSNIASQAAQSEFARLQSIHDKRTANLQK